MIRTRQDAVARAKAAVERRVVDADQREWLASTISPYQGESDAVVIHGLEGSPFRGLVIETNYVVFACDLEGRRLFTWHTYDGDSWA